jgi:hypothetical protein
MGTHTVWKSVGLGNEISSPVPDCYRICVQIGFRGSRCSRPNADSGVCRNIGPTSGLVLIAITTLAIAYSVTRRTVVNPSLHGVLVGLVAGGVYFLFLLPLSISKVVTFGVVLLVGLLAGLAAAVLIIEKSNLDLPPRKRVRSFQATTLSICSINSFTLFLQKFKIVWSAQP